MRKTFILLASLLLSMTINSQDIVGSWQGLLSVQGMKLRLVFNISKNDTTYSATMDSPDQGVKGITMTKTVFVNNVLSLEHSAAKIQFTGVLGQFGIITGNFDQMGNSFPLILTKAELVTEELKRPQNPIKPFPYISEDIIFDNKKDNFKLAGTLTLPNKNGKFPAVVLISGSGAQNRDEELMGHKPFLVLSDYLTRNDIAVLRFDDRGSFKSEGNFATATTADFSNDVSAALDYLKSRKEIDNNSLGLIGHSEGGLIAPMLASTRTDIKFIILMAAPGINGSELLLLQNEDLTRVNGLDETIIAEAKSTNKRIYDIMKMNTNIDTLKLKLKNEFSLLLKEKETDKDFDEQIEEKVSSLISPWFLYFLRYDPAPALEKLKCKVLAMNGSLDLQVSADINLNKIEESLKKAGNKEYTIKKLEGLNHLFQECKIGSINEYSEIEQTISPIALELIESWINAQK